MIDPECRKVTEKYICCCVRNAADGKRKDDGSFEISPIRVGEYILFYGRRRSTFPFHCLLGPDWVLNGRHIMIYIFLYHLFVTSCLTSTSYLPLLCCLKSII